MARLVKTIKRPKSKKAVSKLELAILNPRIAFKQGLTVKQDYDRTGKQVNKFKIYL